MQDVGGGKEGRGGEEEERTRKGPSPVVNWRKEQMVEPVKTMNFRMTRCQLVEKQKVKSKTASWR
ncbi:hypothetical protein TRIATDRAFT_301993 [Trichoderma atroviride IMI 206040]|uniref:Uncharacterized protein n=1 Tax=Hypocrea atroviridis (strain ATCC 20476 / IMI 206040) TaxID=452589 RepID=G9P689_HYPAI|nr:uncharacterized protein TRIATDRAFT_301993 [Trichoderma atroviride IMI 206040]EHK41420.1 hypothetical protein TRIATDRAFT_301993 [Trichoderma atroviride IMI 206040]